MKIEHTQNPVAAVITGGGSGLGAATARLFATQGIKVAVLDLNIEAARKVADEIGGLAVACNVTDAASAEQALAEARTAFGVERILVNCAGIAPGQRIIGREGPMPLEDFRKAVEINLIGSFNLMRLSAFAMSGLEPLADGERGVIINTASVAAYEGQIGQASYSASKGGVVGMTLPAARELAKYAIRVMTIAPGLMETPMLMNMPPQVTESLVASTLYPHRLGRPDEYAALALHIVTNSLLNGETIRLDGAVRLAPK